MDLSFPTQSGLIQTGIDDLWADSLQGQFRCTEQGKLSPPYRHSSADQVAFRQTTCWTDANDCTSMPF
jgi:hypothetical protein